jgi:hypothetical protein
VQNPQRTLASASTDGMPHSMPDCAVEGRQRTLSQPPARAAAHEHLQPVTDASVRLRVAIRARLLVVRRLKAVALSGRR